MELSFQETQRLQAFEMCDSVSKFWNETLIIVDYEYANIFSFAVLDMKLWLEGDDDLHTDHPLYLFKFIQSQAEN